MKGDAGLLTHIFTDNCGLTDATCATLLEGSYELESLQSFSVKHQEIGLQSTFQIQRLLQKPFPLHL